MTDNNIMTPAELKEWWANEDAISAQEDAEIAEMNTAHEKRMAEIDARWNTVTAPPPKMSVGMKILLVFKAIIMLFALSSLFSDNNKK